MSLVLRERERERERKRTIEKARECVEHFICFLVLVLITPPPPFYFTIHLSNIAQSKQTENNSCSKLKC